LEYYINFWKQLKKKNKRNEKSLSSLLHGNHGLKGRSDTLKLKKIKEYNGSDPLLPTRGNHSINVLAFRALKS